MLDYGPFKEYMLSVPINGVAIAAAQRLTGIQVAYPVGKTGAQLRAMSAYVGSFAGHGVPGTEVAANLVCYLGNQYNGTLTFTGNLEILAKEK